MGDLMKKIAESMGKDTQLETAVSASMRNGERVSKELVACLEDPTENPSVAEMIKNIYIKTTVNKDCDPVDIRYYNSIRKKMDAILGSELKKKLGIEDDFQEKDKK